MRCWLQLALLCSAAAAETGRDWQRGDETLAGPCDVETRPWHTLSASDFHVRYQDKLPVLLTELPANAVFERLTQRERLLADWGAHNVTLATANTYSYGRRRSTLRQYVEALTPQEEDALGLHTLYMFGDHAGSWDDLLSAYALPPFVSRETDEVSLSWGIGAPGSGVPFHIHGAGFSEVVHGRKRWLLFAPHRRPPFNPNASSLSWFRAWQAGEPALLAHGAPLDCTIEPGSALYFPADWWHATLNVGDCVFMSTFVNWRTPPADTELR